jgi:hypothetical protein
MKKAGSFGEKNKKTEPPIRSSVGTTNSSSGSGQKKPMPTTVTSGSNKPAVGGVSPSGKSKK